VGANAGEDQMFRLTYDGSMNDEPQFVVMGGQAEAIINTLKATYADGMELPAALDVAVRALTSVPAGPGNSAANAPERPRLEVDRLEVAVLERCCPRNRRPSHPSRTRSRPRTTARADRNNPARTAVAQR
jgi:proteasome alpha subunit